MLKSSQRENMLFIVPCSSAWFLVRYVSVYGNLLKNHSFREGWIQSISNCWRLFLLLVPSNSLVRWFQSELCLLHVLDEVAPVVNGVSTLISMALSLGFPEVVSPRSGVPHFLKRFLGQLCIGFEELLFVYQVSVFLALSIPPDELSTMNHQHWMETNEVWYLFGCLQEYPKRPWN